MIADVGNLHMWATFVIIVIALSSYVAEKWPMELTSLGTISVLLAMFAVFPLPGDDPGTPGVTAADILAGFANTALIAVLALLVMGQGVIRTGMLDRAAQWSMDRLRKKAPAFLGVFVVLFVVGAVSAFLNNTPVVVIFIPIMHALAQKYGLSTSRLMMPLSFAAILGGMTTLIGSSTNLLVNTALTGIGEAPLGFFDFTVPGLFMAGAGLVYAVLFVPRLLPDRAKMSESVIPAGSGKQFMLQIDVRDGDSIVGATARAGIFPAFSNMTVRMVQRGERAFLPPFDEITIRPGDVMVIAATRAELKDALAEDPELFHPDLGNGAAEDADDDAPWTQGDQTVAEVMVAPASRFVGQTLRMAGFRYKTNCIVLGIERRARMIRTRMTEIRLEAGDVLLVQGQGDDIRALRNMRDVVLIESSRENLPKLDHAKSAAAIFFGAVALAALGVVPIVVAAFVGAVMMVAAGVLNVRQAFRAMDAKIATAIAAALAMSTALRETGGAMFIATQVVAVFQDAGPLVVASCLFLIAAVMTNILSNNAVAVLFTPIAVDLAIALNVEPTVFAIAMVFAANCSFASPMGYQTNLLVMGPGHYKFVDFVKAGLPLILIMWGVYTLLARMYWGL